jgi:hypothetical protein
MGRCCAIVKGKGKPRQCSRKASAGGLKCKQHAKSVCGSAVLPPTESHTCAEKATGFPDEKVNTDEARRNVYNRTVIADMIPATLTAAEVCREFTKYLPRREWVAESFARMSQSTVVAAERFPSTDPKYYPLQSPNIRQFVKLWADDSVGLPRLYDLSRVKAAFRSAAVPQPHTVLLWRGIEAQDAAQDAFLRRQIQVGEINTMDANKCIATSASTDVAENFAVSTSKFSRIIVVIAVPASSRLVLPTENTFEREFILEPGTRLRVRPGSLREREFLFWDSVKKISSKQRVLSAITDPVIY